MWMGTGAAARGVRERGARVVEMTLDANGVTGDHRWRGHPAIE